MQVIWDVVFTDIGFLGVVLILPWPKRVRTLCKLGVGWIIIEILFHVPMENFVARFM